MRMKRVVEKCTLSSAVAEFYAFKRVQKIRERTLYDYQRYIDPFVEQSSNSMNVTVLKREILAYFANIPTVRQGTTIHINTSMPSLRGVPNKTTFPTTPSTSLN